MFSRHISIANRFAASLDSVFSHFHGVRKTRRQKEQIDADQLHALDGDSSSKMSEVWALWESTFVQAKITPVPEPRIRDDILHKWAWNKRAPSCPPLHRLFQRQMLKPLDRTYTIPDGPARKRDKYIFHPFTAEERTFLVPYRSENDEITPEFDLPTATQQPQITSDPVAATASVELPALPRTQGKKTASSGSRSYSYSTRRATSTRVTRTTKTKPKDPATSKSPAPEISQVEDEQIVVLPHPVWEVVDVDVGPHAQSAIVGCVTVVLGTASLPEYITLQFYSGMVSTISINIIPVIQVLTLSLQHTDLRRTLTIIHAVLRGVSFEGYVVVPQQREFDLRESPAYGVEIVHHGDWDNKPMKDQRHAFSLNNVHVNGKPSMAVLPNVSSLSSVEELSLAMDLDKPLLCQGTPFLFFCFYMINILRRSYPSWTDRRRTRVSQ